MAKVTRYTVNAKAGGACARCGANFRAGDAAEALVEDGYVEHRHVACERPAEDGAALGARLMADIRAGKPPVNTDPEHDNRKVQGT